MTDAGWQKREAVTTNLVVMGDGEGQAKKVGGLLIGTPMDKQYPDKMNYTIVRQNGEEITLGGNATLGRQITAADVGKFIKCEFIKWERGGNGKYKVIEVFVYNGEPTPQMKAWPRWEEFQAPKAPAPAPASAHQEVGPDDDELPF